MKLQSTGQTSPGQGTVPQRKTTKCGGELLQPRGGRTLSNGPAQEPHLPDYEEPIQVPKKDNDKIKMGFYLVGNLNKI